MIEREYVKWNTSVQTGSNAQNPITDIEGNPEAVIDVRFPDNLFTESSRKKVHTVEMQPSKLRLSQELTPIAQLPLDEEKSTSTNLVSTCQLDVWPFCWLDDGTIKPETLAETAFPKYKSKTLETPHMFNLCFPSNLENFDLTQKSSVLIQKLGTLEQILQDALENAMTWACVDGDFTSATPPTVSLCAGLKPKVQITPQGLSISYDTAPFTVSEVIPVLWNQSFIETFEQPKPLKDDCDGWYQPPPKRAYLYDVVDGETSYNFNLKTGQKAAPFNIVGNKAMRDTFSFLPWFKIDTKANSLFTNPETSDTYLPHVDLDENGCFYVLDTTTVQVEKESPDPVKTSPVHLVEYKNLEHGVNYVNPVPITTSNYSNCYRYTHTGTLYSADMFCIDVGVVIGGSIDVVSDRRDVRYYITGLQQLEENAEFIFTQGNASSGFTQFGEEYDRNVNVTNSFYTCDTTTYPVGRSVISSSIVLRDYLPDKILMTATNATTVVTGYFFWLPDKSDTNIARLGLPVYNQYQSYQWNNNGTNANTRVPTLGVNPGYTYLAVQSILPESEAPEGYDYEHYVYYRIQYKQRNYSTGTYINTIHYVSSNPDPGRTTYYVQASYYRYQAEEVMDVTEVSDIGNVRLSFSWNNLPTVVMSPISSIILTLDGINLNCEIQPVNINLPAGSSLTQSIPVVENYYSLATTLRDLHDELVITRPDFDGNTKYTLDKQAGRERTVKIAAKYLTKDGKLHQLFIPKNGVFSVQFTFRITYSIY